MFLKIPNLVVVRSGSEGRYKETTIIAKCEIEGHAATGDAQNGNGYHEISARNDDVFYIAPDCGREWQIPTPVLVRDLGGRFVLSASGNDGKQDRDEANEREVRAP